MAAGSFDELMASTTERVKAIHPELVWEARQGSSAQHMLCVTAGGIREAREASERWFRAAPQHGKTWEFSQITPPLENPLGLTLFLGNEAVALHELRFVVRPGTKLDVTVCHESFARTDQRARTEAAFSVVDALLGEDSVMRWIGALDTAVEPELGAVEAEQLPSIVTAFARRSFDSWQVRERTPSEGALSVLRTRSAEWMDRPDLELHCALTLRYSTQDRTGFPDAAEVARLDEVEEQLENKSESSRILVAIETGQGRRVLHYYANPSGSGTEALDDYVRDNAEATLERQRDPYWESLRTLQLSR